MSEAERREQMIEACTGALTLWGVPRQIGRKVMEDAIPKSGKVLNLKPCPFCGCKATTEFNELNGKKYMSVGCKTKKCCGSHGVTAAPEELWAEEISAWNTRNGR